MTKDKATARPWEIFEDGNFVKIGAQGYVEWTERNHYLGGPLSVAGMACNATENYSSDHARALANAELIVTAVNERDQLLAEVARLRDGSAEGVARNVKLLLDRNVELQRALAAYVKFSDEAALLLDQDRDAKCLKLLLAMAGRSPRYRHDVDVARAALSSDKEEGE